ncbi:hypothetical protein C9374_010414 [Naegleria lovaniensis]|uniref:BTB domain-containing protein n=1 Tax=Naegleria lovaniensis TaxID=51637 RepID=A0AA88GBJ3_NAELO|nr:uncharacterized protein C9374_010414 [Naegleria lovaniensis]KAG2374670.1 hypothetical protein C9374_010414 [Naegleria lovaniensis]
MLHATIPFSPNAPSYDIYSYCKKGDLQKVKSLLNLSELETPDSFGNTLLYYACLCGHLQLVHFLSELGARDDKYKRCYINALSLNVRSLLKVYNKYSNEETHKEDVEDEESSSLQSFMLKKVKRILFENERNLESDVVLKIRFSGQHNESRYYCHWWILLARWPFLLYWALVQKNRPIPHVHVFLTSHEQKLLTLKTNKEIEKFCFSQSGTVLFVHEIRNAIKKIRKEIEDIQQGLSYKRAYEEQMQELLDALPESELDLKELMSSQHVSCIDLGSVEFPKQYFDLLLVWMYTGKFTDPNSSKMEYPTAQLATMKDFLNMAESLKIYEVVDILTSHRTKGEIDMNHSYCTAMTSCYFMESYQPKTKLELLRKLCCDFKLKIENYLEETYFVPTEESILCHKNFLMERSPFFQVMIQSNFDEGEKIRQLQACHELPILHLQCCTLSVLEELCRCLYSGKLQLQEHNAIELFSYAHRLGMSSEVLLQCESYIKEMQIDESELYAFCKVCFPLFTKKTREFFEVPLIKYLQQQQEINVYEALEELDYDTNTIEIIMLRYNMHRTRNSEE